MKKTCWILVLFVAGSMTVVAGPPPPPPHRHHGCGNNGLGLAAGIMGLVDYGFRIIRGPYYGYGPGVVVVPQQPVMVAAPPQPTIVYQTPTGGYCVQPLTQPVRVQYYQPAVQTVSAGYYQPPVQTVYQQPVQSTMTTVVQQTQATSSASTPTKVINVK